MSLFAAAPRWIRPADKQLGVFAFWSLLALAGGTLVFARDFSHLMVNIGGVPVFVTEAFLALWAVTLLPRAHALARNVSTTFFLAIAAYLLIGLVTLLLSLRGSTSLLSVIRDSAIFYYAFFAIVAADLLASASRAQAFMRIVALSAVPLCMLGFLKLASQTDLEVTTSGTLRALSGAQGLFAVLSLVASLSGLALAWKPRSLYLATLMFALLAIPLAQSRSLTLAVLLAIPTSTLIINRRRPVLGVAMAVALIGVLSALPNVYDAAGIAKSYGSRESAFVGAAAPIIAPTTAPTDHPATAVLSADPNISWRLKTWSVALSYVAAHPATGMGFGQLHLLPGVVAKPDDPVAPHNSLITLAFESGIPGVVAFGFVVVTFYALCAATIRCGTSQQQVITSFALSTQFAIMVMLLFNVVLEGPYMAMFFWLAVGLVAPMVMRKARREPA